MPAKPESMPTKPESLTEAHAEIYRLVGLLHRQQQDLARNKRMVELLKRVPPDLAERVDPALIEAMARARRREGRTGRSRTARARVAAVVGGDDAARGSQASESRRRSGRGGALA